MALQEGHEKTNETINFSFFPAAMQRNGVIMVGGGGDQEVWGSRGCGTEGGWCVQQGTWMELVMML